MGTVPELDWLCVSAGCSRARHVHGCVHEPLARRRALLDRCKRRHAVLAAFLFGDASVVL